MRRITDFMAPSDEYVNGGDGYVPPLTSDTQHNLVAGRDSAGAHPASAITNTPAGNIVATTIQAAINELDTEKQASLTWPLTATRPTALTASGTAVSGTAGGTYTSTEQTLINDLKALANNLKTRVDELETKLKTIGAIS